MNDEWSACSITCILVAYYTIFLVGAFSFFWHFLPRARGATPPLPQVVSVTSIYIVAVALLRVKLTLLLLLPLLLVSPSLCAVCMIC